MYTCHGDISFFFNFSEPNSMYIFGPKITSGYSYNPTTIASNTLANYVTNSVTNGASHCAIAIRNRILYGCYNYNASGTTYVIVFYVRPN
jgi:hypothetical protein